MVHDDPVLAKAVARATAAHTRALAQWSTIARRGDVDPAIVAEVRDHAREALEHLDGGRYDEARAAADLCVELDESDGDGEIWRDFGLLVEEAAETGNALV